VPDDVVDVRITPVVLGAEQIGERAILCVEIDREDVKASASVCNCKRGCSRRLADTVEASVIKFRQTE
jgi:predicted RNA methylase